MGQEVEVRPGIIQKDAEGRVACTPIYSRIVSLFAEQNALQFAVPGGLIGVGTTARAAAAPPAGRALRARRVLSEQQDLAVFARSRLRARAAPCEAKRESSECARHSAHPGLCQDPPGKGERRG